MEKHFVPQWVDSMDRVEKISRFYNTHQNDQSFTPLVSIDGACLFYVNPFMFSQSLITWMQVPPSLLQAKMVIYYIVTALVKLKELEHGNLHCGNIFICDRTVFLGPMSDIHFSDKLDLILIKLILANPIELEKPLSDILELVIKNRRNKIPLKSILDTLTHFPIESPISSYTNTYHIIKNAVEKKNTEMTIYPKKPDNLFKSAIQYVFARLI